MPLHAHNPYFSPSTTLHLQSELPSYLPPFYHAQLPPSPKPKPSKRQKKTRKERKNVMPHMLISHLKPQPKNFHKHGHANMQNVCHAQHHKVKPTKAVVYNMFHDSNARTKTKKMPLLRELSTANSKSTTKNLSLPRLLLLACFVKSLSDAISKSKQK